MCSKDGLIEIYVEMLSLHYKFIHSFIHLSLPEGSLLVGRGNGVVLVYRAAALLATAALRLRPAALVDALRGKVEALPAGIERLRHVKKTIKMFLSNLFRYLTLIVLG